MKQSSKRYGTDPGTLSERLRTGTGPLAGVPANSRDHSEFRAEYERRFKPTILSRLRDDVEALKLWRGEDYDEFSARLERLERAVLKRT